MKKYICVILYCSFLLTSCGKIDNSIDSSDVISDISIDTTFIVTSNDEEIIESTSVTEIVNEDRSCIFDLKWNDSIDVVKERMSSYICTFEESNMGDVEGTTIKTGLSYIDVDFFGEVCGVTFKFDDYKLSDIYFTYIWEDNNTMSPEEWTEKISEKFGESTPLENSDNAYIWKDVYNGTTNIILSWWEYGIDINFENATKESSEEYIQVINDDNSEKIIKMYSDMASVKQQMSDYNLISEEDTVNLENNPQTLLTYKYILQNGSECELCFAFQSVGLIGINFRFPKTMYEGIALFDNIYNNVSTQHGDSTDYDEYSNGERMAFWTNNPYGKDTSLYLARYDDSSIQFSYWANEYSNANKDSIDGIDISIVPITDYSFFTDDPNLVNIKEYSDIDENFIPKNDLDVINSLIYSTRVIDGHSASFGSVILEMCLDFKTTFQRSNLNNSIYIVKFSGQYLPIPDQIELNEKGAISLKIDVDSNTCELYKGGTMYQSMVTYAVLY